MVETTNLYQRSCGEGGGVIAAGTGTSGNRSELARVAAIMGAMTPASAQVTFNWAAVRNPGSSGHPATRLDQGRSCGGSRTHHRCLACPEAFSFPKPLVLVQKRRFSRCVLVTKPQANST